MRRLSVGSPLDEPPFEDAVLLEAAGAGVEVLAVATPPGWLGL